MTKKQTLELFKDRHEQPDDWLSRCENAKTLIEAIEIATDPENKNSHQYRIPKSQLLLFRERLIQILNSLEKSKNYEDLYDLVDSVGRPIYQIGDLTIYDVATRISFYLGIRPTNVYLHAGTRVGAEFYLDKRLVRKKYIELDEIPQWIRGSGLEPYQIEVFFCICKKGNYP